MEFSDLAEATVETWLGIPPPNVAARLLAADLAASIAAYEKVRDRMRFEDEPASFLNVLQECAE